MTNVQFSSEKKLKYFKMYGGNSDYAPNVNKNGNFIVRLTILNQSLMKSVKYGKCNT